MSELWAVVPPVRHDRYCSRPACRKASKAASQALVWPASIPVLLNASNYSVEDDYGVISSAVNRGRPKTRRRFNAVIVRRHVTVRITANQLPDWRLFYASF